MRSAFFAPPTVWGERDFSGKEVQFPARPSLTTQSRLAQKIGWTSAYTGAAISMTQKKRLLTAEKTPVEFFQTGANSDYLLCFACRQIRPRRSQLAEMDPRTTKAIDSEASWKWTHPSLRWQKLREIARLRRILALTPHIGRKPKRVISFLSSPAVEIEFWHFVGCLVPAQLCSQLRWCF